jgi:nucleoside-diphosphate-sugar epimerase
MLGFTPTVSLEEGMKELTDWYFSKIKVAAS